MQSVSSRIWTRVAVSISYDDNHYTSSTSNETHISLSSFLMPTDYFIQETKSSFNQEEVKNLLFIEFYYYNWP